MYSMSKAMVGRNLVRVALVSFLIVPTAFSPTAIALTAPVVVPPKPLTTRPLVLAHKLNLGRQQNHLQILQAGPKYGDFLIRQPGHPEVKAADFDALMRTLNERQRNSPHEALKIVPEFEDAGHLERFSAQLKTRRPSYFPGVTTPLLPRETSAATRFAFSTSALNAVRPDGAPFSTTNGHWAQDLSFETQFGNGSPGQRRTVRVISTLKELVEDVRNYLVWAYNHLVRSGSGSNRLVTADMVVSLALVQLATDSNMSESELRSMVTVQFGGLDVVLFKNESAFASAGSGDIQTAHETK